MSPACPSCPGAPALLPMEAAATTLGFCGSCRGLWVGRDEWRVALGRPLQGDGPAARQRGLPCPACGREARLDTRALAGPPPVEIDRCPRCEGTWLDPGEMTALRQALRRTGGAALGDQLVDAWKGRATAPASAGSGEAGSPPARLPAEVVATDRPDPAFWSMTLVQSLLVVVGSLGLALPIVLIALIPAWFRYHTTRYAFDDEGIGVSWGFIFHHATHVTYGKIQDIHLNRGLLERWFGLGTVQLQTASGSSAAEATLYGLRNADTVRDYLYQRMRGFRDEQAETAAGPSALELLEEIRDEVARLRAALEAPRGAGAAEGGRP